MILTQIAPHSEDVELWLYSWPLCQRRGGTLAIFMASLPENGWTSGYIHGSVPEKGKTLFMALGLC